MSQHDQREKLFERAKYGEISGEEADAEAVRLGLSRFSSEPGLDEFRPEDLTHWTLPMALAWIAYMDLEEVREWSAPYRAECFDWHWQRRRVGFEGPIHEGWHLEQRSKPTLSLLAIRGALDSVDEGRRPVMSIGDAQKALWIALKEALITATGINLKTERRVEIAALDWHELVAVEGGRETDEVRRGLLGSGYREPLFRSAALRGLWHPVPAKTSTLPMSMPPAGEGYMPLYCAAQWIATKGATFEFDPEDNTVWRVAYDQLLAAIASEHVRVVGTCNGQREVVPAFHFAGCEVDYPFGSVEMEVLAGEDLYLRSYPYLDEESWRGGFDDALMNHRHTRWTRLMVEEGDVRSRWPFPTDEIQEIVELQSGLPGRPSKSKHLSEDEFQRRAEAAELADSLSLEAKELHTWLRATYPDYPPPTVKTIENNILAKYRLKKFTK